MFQEKRAKYVWFCSRKWANFLLLSVVRPIVYNVTEREEEIFESGSANSNPIIFNYITSILLVISKQPPSPSYHITFINSKARFKTQVTHTDTGMLNDNAVNLRILRFRSIPVTIFATIRSPRIPLRFGENINKFR